MTEFAQSLISLSIVSHGNAALVERLLSSLSLHERADRLQIILTDNLGFDLPEFDPAPWRDLKILRNEHPSGFARNHNQAFQAAEGKYYCVVNPDVFFEQPVLDSLLARLHVGAADLIAPLIVDENGDIQDSFRSLPTPWKIVRRRLSTNDFEPAAPDAEGLIRPDWIAGILLLMPASVYQLLGGFDERYWLYFEDTDLCTRARLEGLRLAVDARVRLRHDAQRASHRRFYYFRRHMESAVRFFTSEIYRQAKKLD